MKSTNTNTATVAATPTTPDMPIRTAHLAKQFSLKATALRRILRSMPAYADGVHTNYRWSENDPRIAAIGQQIAKLAADKLARAQAAKAALDARTKAAQVQQKADDKLKA